MGVISSKRSNQVMGMNRQVSLLKRFLCPHSSKWVSKLPKNICQRSIIEQGSQAPTQPCPSPEVEFCLKETSSFKLDLV
jgi:hypothetical protein